MLLILYILIIIVITWFIHTYLISKDINNLRTYQKSLMEFYTMPYHRNIQALRMIPTYVINLDSSSIRMNHIIREFKRYGLSSPSRIRAVNGKGIKNKRRGTIDGIQYNLNYTVIMWPLSGPEIGCLMSHFKAIRQARDDGHEMAIIMEDDVSLELIPHIDTSLMELIGAADDDWEIIHLSAMNQDNLIREMMEPLRFKRDFSIRNSLFATGYLIHQRGMNRLLDRFMPIPYTINIHTTNKKILSYVADVFIYHETKSLLPNRIFLIPFNNDTSMNSNINTDHTNIHVQYAFNIARHVLGRPAPFESMQVMHLSKMMPNLKKNNPHWAFHIRTEDEYLQIVNTFNPSIRNPHDIRNLVLVYLFGGIAASADSPQKMDSIVSRHDALLMKDDFVYASRPRHPFLKYVIDQYQKNQDSSVSELIQSCYDRFNRHLPGYVHLNP